MKKNVLLVLIIAIFIGISFLFYPQIEFYKNGYLYMMSFGKDFEFSEDFEELEYETCYDESYSYNDKRNISIKGWEYEGFLFFRWFKVSYIEGNICDSEYLLEESYIDKFLDKAVIISNEDNIDLAKLIEGKKAILANKRYPWEDNSSYIEYTLDDTYMEMYVRTTEEGLVIIQVGASDEGPKYIAYQ